MIDRDTGSTLNTYRHDGKLYIAGTPGHRYAVHVAKVERADQIFFRAASGPAGGLDSDQIAALLRRLAEAPGPASAG